MPKSTSPFAGFSKRTEPRIVLSIFVVAAFFLLMPQLSRINEPFAGSSSYYHARMAESLSSGIPSSDSLAFGRPYIINAYDIFLYLASRLAPVGLLSRLVPPILGIASLFLFYLLARPFLRREVLYAAVAILALSSVFIYAFSVSSPVCFAVFLNLLGIYLLSLRRPFFFFSIPVFALIPFFGFLHIIIALLLLFLFAFYSKRLKRALLASLLLVAASLAYLLPLLFKLGFSGNLNPAGRDYLADLVFSFGSSPGFNIFTILLVGIGFYICLEYKRTLAPLYLSTFFLLVLFYFFKDASVYLAFLFAFFAASGIVKLAIMRWELAKLRDISIAILIVGILFSSTTFVSSLASSQPTSELAASMLAIRGLPSGAVLSHYSYGFWLEYFAGKPSLVDPGFVYAPNLLSRLNDSYAMFQSRNLKRTASLLDNYTIRYVLVSPEMRHGLVWSRPDDGLLFLFRNNKTFKNVYNSSGIEVWEYIGKNESSGQG